MLTFHKSARTLVNALAFIFCFFLSIPGFSQEIPRIDEQGNIIPQLVSKKRAFVKGELLIKFGAGVLDSLKLEKDNPVFELAGSVIKKPGLKNALQTAGGVKLQKVVSHLKPSHKFSLSRSGKQTPIPPVYRLMKLTLPKKADIEKLCKQLSQLEGVVYAEPNYLFYPDANPPNDPQYNKQRGLEQANDIDIDAETAWSYTTGSYDVIVGVIDSGIDYNNEDLGGGQWGSPGDKVSTVELECQHGRDFV